MVISKTTQRSCGIMLPRIFGASAIAGAIGSGLFAVPELAQAASAPGPTAEPAIREVQISARRVRENLQKVPVAVTALSGADLKQQSVTRLEELPWSVPGLTATPSYYASVPNYSIRGQRGAIDPTLLYDPAVTVYFAEMNQVRAQGTNGELFDLESVQVLKGPQGTLFGRNTTGGAILITPKAPTDKFGGYLQTGLGTFDYRDAEGVLNIPLTDKAALRLGGKTTRRDGYMDNIATGVKGNGLVSDSARISLLLKPTDSVRSTFIAAYSESRNDGAVMKLASVQPTSFLAFGVPQFVIDAFQQDAAAQAALGPYKLMSPNDLIAHDRVASIQNNTEIDLRDNLSIRNSIGYRHNTLDSESDFTAASFDYFAIGNQNRVNQVTEELQLLGKDGKLDYVIGAYVLREDGNQGGFSRLAPIAEFGLFSNDVSTTSYAGFAHGNYDLASLLDGLSITAGARWTYDRKKVDFSIFDTSGFAPGVFTCSLNGAVFASADFGNCSSSASTSSTEPTYDISVNYQVTPNLLTYVAHRRGYRAGGFNINPGSAPAIPYKPEYVDDVELGVKSDFHIGAMPGRLNAAAYYQWYKDIQRVVVFGSDGSLVNGLTNTAKADIYGGELELTLQPTPALEVGATYSYVKATYSKWDDLYLNTSFAMEKLDISDSHFSFVPANQWSLKGRYAFPLPAQYGQLSLSAIWYGQSSMATNDNTTSNCGSDGFYIACYSRPARVPGYNFGNVHLDWNNVGGNGFDLSLFVNNVTDRVYQNNGFGFGGVLGTSAIGYGPPRMAGLALKVPFGGEAY